MTVDLATMPLNGTPQDFFEDVAVMARWMNVIHAGSKAVELRALECVENGYRKPHTRCGYFDPAHFSEMSKRALLLSRDHSPAVYFTLNEVHPDFLSRLNNRDDNTNETVSDKDIVGRRLMLVDLDAKRRARISSTEAEKNASRELAEKIRDELSALGLPKPIFADSGNGYHLLYRIDLPTDDGGIVEHCLKALAVKYDTDLVKVDTSVFNPSRIVKMYGTVPRKGDNTSERPWRRSKILEIPDAFNSSPVPRELLEPVAAQSPKNQQRSAGPSQAAAPGNPDEWEPVTPKLLSRVRSYMARVPPAESGQHGHDATIKAANILIWRFALPGPDAMSILSEWNRTCSPPWSEADLLRKLDEALKNPVGVQGELRQKATTAKSNSPDVDVSDLPWVPAEGDWVRAKDRGNYGKVVGVDHGMATVRFVNPDDGNTAEIEYPFSEIEPHKGKSSAPQKPILRFSVRTMQAAYPHLDPPVIDGWLREREIANIISVAKIGKSWLLYYLLLCVATSRSVFDRFKTAGGRVLLIDNELPPPLLPYRIRTVAEAMGIQQEEYIDKFDVWSLRHSPRSIFELWAEFEAAAAPPKHYRVIALDAKYKSLAPDADENSNADEARYFAEAGVLAENTGSALILVHHSTKGNQSDKRIVDVGAGGSSQARAADSHLVLREHEEDDAVVLAGAVRSFEPVKPLGLRWDFPLWTPDGSLDTEALKGKKSATEEKQDERDQEIDGKILDFCQTWRSRREIKTRFGWSDGRRDRAICRLLDAKLLEAKEEERRGNPCEVFRKTIHAR